MALRDKLASRTQPFLEPGEQVTQIFAAQSGPNPWMIPLIGPIIVMLVSKMRVRSAQSSIESKLFPWMFPHK